MRIRRWDAARRPVRNRRAARAGGLAAAAGLLLATMMFGSVAAAGFVALDLGQRLAAAHDAATGVVATVDVEVRDGEPWTVVTIDVERVWRQGGERAGADTDPAPTLSATFWGGRAPGVAPLQVAGMPTFAVGERVLWLLRAADEGLAAPTVGVTQGVWRAIDGAWSGDDGSVLGVDENGDLGLAGPSVPDSVLFAALDEAFDALEPTP